MDDAITWLRTQRPEMERCLRELVEAPSYTKDKRDCDRVGALLRTYVPLPCERTESEAFGAHLFFHGGRASGERGVVLVGHLDTVFPRGTFEGYRVEDDIARGPGVLDMKGGLVVVAWALQALARAGVEVPLSFAVVADEEVGSPESAARLRDVARGADCALVFESGRAGDAIITRRKGTGTVTVDARGRAAHAGNAHHLGASAVRALARWIDRAEALTDTSRGVTVNVGRVEGGTSKNTVPAAARAEVDFRYVDPVDGEAIVHAMHALAAPEGHAVPGVTLTVAGGVSRSPLTRTEASAALCARYAGCQRDAGLADGEAPLVGGGSDASTTADAGVASIDGLGPRGEGFHTTGEYVELATLVPKAEALLRFLATLRG